MLEGLTKIGECEDFLRSQIAKAALIGYLELTDKDYGHLTSLVRAQVERLGYARAATLLGTDWPAVLSTLLVWTGIFHYRAGNYWPAVREQAGIPREQALQTKLVKAFEKFLKDFHLVTFEKLSTSSNVNRILAHGLIPNYCLQDFFEKLLREFLLGKFRGARANLHKALSEWRASTAGAMFTDKPVLNFVFSDEPIARDFFLECILLAESLSRGDALPDSSTPAVPRRVRALLSRWLETGSTGIGLETREVKSRFVTPEFVLDPQEGEVAIRIPSQSVGAVYPTDNVTCSVLWEDGKEAAAQLDVVCKQGAAKSSVTHISCLSRSEALVFFQVDGKVVREFPMKPLDQEQGWFAFGDPSKVLLKQGCVLPTRCWILLPASWSFADCPGFRILEESIAFHGPWAGFRAVRVESTLGKLQLRKPDDSIIAATVQAHDAHEPVLLDTTKVPHCDSRGVPVYASMPRLKIPAGWSSARQVELSLKNSSLSGSSRYHNVVEIHTLLDEKLVLEKVLAVGGTRPGDYELVVTSAAGKSKKLRFAVVPKLSVELDRTLYWIELPGQHPVASVELNSPSLQSVTPTDAVKCSYFEPGKWVLRGSISQAMMQVNLALTDRNQRIEMPLAIRLPHVEFGVSSPESTGTAQFTMSPLEISLADINAGSQLLVRFSEFAVEKVALQLERHEQSVVQAVRNGQAIFDLRRFADSFQTSKMASAKANLLIDEDRKNPVIIPAATLHKDWIVTQVRVETRLVGGDRIVEMRWHNQGISKRRRLRLWNLAMPWTTPIADSIQDNVSSVLLRVPESQLPPGPYRVEFFQDDEWFTDDTQSQLPEPNEILVHDVQIGSHSEIQKFLTSLDTTFAADLTRTLVRCYISQAVGVPNAIYLPDTMSSADIDALVKSTFALANKDVGRRLAIKVWSQIVSEPPSGLQPESLVRTLTEILPQLPPARRDVCETILKNISTEIYGVLVEPGQYVRHNGLVARYIGPDATGKYRLRFRDGDVLISEDLAKALVVVPDSSSLDYMTRPRRTGRTKEMGIVRR